MYDKCDFYVYYDLYCDSTRKYWTLPDTEQQNSGLRFEKNEKSRFVLNVKRPFV